MAKAYDDKMKTLFGRAGLDRRYDAFRHSYASYRIRQLRGNLAALAEEMGNSPAEIINSYKRNVTDVQAAAWFGLFPPPEYANMVRVALGLSESA
jgi:hypothetical protein